MNKDYMLRILYKKELVVEDLSDYDTILDKLFTIMTQLQLLEYSKQYTLVETYIGMGKWKGFHKKLIEIKTNHYTFRVKKVKVGDIEVDHFLEVRDEWLRRNKIE